jgi:tRNA pseudouridine55 synthase
MNECNGWIIIDKELGISSASVVYKVKKLLKAKKVGHGGTLDPLASGLLPIAVGEATKLSSYAMDHEKEYLFTIAFGSSTSTDDREGEVVATSDVRPLEIEIKSILSEFTGHIQQAPPIYSAIHVDGKRAYDLARAGEITELPKREVFIKDLQLVKYTTDACEFKVTCGKGTYIRSLARDIALRLGTFGHISFLRRTKVGKFSIEDGISLDKLKDLVHNLENTPKTVLNCDLCMGFLMSVNIVLDDILVLEVTDLQVLDLRCGRLINTELNFCNDQLLRAQDSNGKLIALGKYYDNKFKPTRVFNY